MPQTRAAVFDALGEQAGDDGVPALLLGEFAGGRHEEAFAAGTAGGIVAVRATARLGRQLGLPAQARHPASGRSFRVKEDQKANRRKRGSTGGRPPAFDPDRYKARNTVERCLNKLKNFRAVATRFDKREPIYQGTIDVASIRIWLRHSVT